MSDARRMTVEPVDDVDGDMAAEIERLDREERDIALQAGLYGGTDTPAADTVRPFDVEVPRPRAVPLRRLYELLNKAVPPELEVSRTRVPLLIHQGLTAFNPPGKAPASVWGLGYQINFEDIDADTVAVEPSTKLLEVAKLDQTIHLSLSVGGALGVPKTMDGIGRKLPGVALEGVEIGASTDQELELGISFRFELLKIEAGPIGTGGARWNVYRQDERLAGFQPLLHTVLVPKSTKQLKATVTTWVVRAGRWFGLVKPVRWVSQPQTFTVPVEGL